MLRIAKKIKVVGECHIWQGCIDRDGYPAIGRNANTNVKGHRYVYEQTKGEIPKGYVVRHTCDNTLCLNPEHLVVGTVQDNVQDRVNRGRSFGHVSEEEASSVLQLRASGMFMKDIAAKLNIKHKRVEYILNKLIKESL